MSGEIGVPEPAIVALASPSWRAGWTSGEVRAAFADAADAVVELVSRPEVGQRWDDPSALTDMTIGALAAHVCRAVLLVSEYADAPSPAEAAYDAPGYFAVLTALVDPGSELNRGVAQRARESAAIGHERLVEQVDSAARDVRERLATEPAARVVSVIGAMSLNLDDYLCTRLVEICVHLDDLAVSLGDSGAVLPDAAAQIATAVCVEIAARRNGRLDVLRGLTRAERSIPSGTGRAVFPVF